jgi:hypothetical protein
MQRGLLISAAVLLGFIGVVHSVLGERYVFRRLFALPNLPLLRRDRVYTEHVLRYAWHLTSVAWWGFGALLLVLALGSGGISGLGAVVAATLLLTGVVILMTAGLRHPAWSLFLLAGAVTLYATW